ncbi:hypothetical protein J1N10_20425 [Carboxylicivirga sp. A043]|uniref:hypothetical protein n=1 Tax=Carboxylicivirga litoralis TaxID=2816963 RepID=UPI0021CB94FD|nr:hypothetical protein [Carboxylicivirga sp. A043]MCU4158351.1 hypothetical protein [Carboxylicivirga sp. A043]
MKFNTKSIKKASEGNPKALECIKTHFIELIHSHKTLKKSAPVNDMLHKEVNRITSIAIDFLSDDKIRPFKMKIKKISQESLRIQDEEPFVTTAIKAKRSKFKEFSILCKVNDLKVQDELERFMDKWIAQHRDF